MMPPPGFSTPPQIPSNTTSERLPITTIVFVATTPENKPFAYHASTSTNPNPTISPSFLDANYEILQSLLRERRRQIRNKDLQTKLEYFSEDYDEEREMEPRPEPRREATPTLRTQMGNPPAGGASTYQGGYIPQAFTNNSIPSYNGPIHPTITPSSSYPFYAQPMYAPPNMHAYPNPAGPFTHSSGFVTPFVRWIEDYPLLYGLKMTSHIGSYDGKGDPDNFLHLFERAIRMQKWLMPVACHMFMYTLKDSTRIWWNSQKTDLPSTYKGLMEKTYTWVKVREVATNGASNDQRDSFERSKKSSWDNNRGQKNKDRFSPYRGSNHGLLPSLLKSPKEILATKKAARSFKLPPKMFGRSKKDKSTAPAEAPILMVNNTPVIREAKIFGRKVGRVYMDSGSSCEIIYEHCIEKLNPTIKAAKLDLKTPLVGFSRERSWSVGEVPLEITIGDAPLSRKETLNFVIVKSNSSHNMLLGRTAMQRIGIVVLTIHGAIKFHTKKGIGTVFLTSEADEGEKRARKIPATSKERIPSCTNTEEQIIINNKYPDQTVTIGKQLPNHFKKELQSLLKSNADIFAWTHADMTGILRTIMVEGKPFNTKHKLNEYSHIKPIKQNKRGLGPDRNMSAYKETEELTKAGILRKVKHQTWVANPVMVKKSDGGWRMCVDFTDINKAYPKDCYLLPEIDWKIESLSGFCLKWATYQRLVDKVFSHQIGRNLEAYVDDMVIKSTYEEEMLKDIQETFKRFQSINMKLNPKKYSYDVEEGPFLGHLITKHGIKANPSKVKAVTDLDQPRTLKDIQSLNGKLAALSRFLSKGAKRSLAFFKVLKECQDKKSIQLKKTRRVAKWAIELGEHDIVFLRREEKETPVDFLIKIPSEDNKTKEKPKEVPDSSSKWRLYTDGASNSDGLRAGLMLIDPEGKEYTYALRFKFETTKNKVEYEALLAGLRIA
ncbi:reverse transcriptase domain-containing protein [Tanacetum coccineum]